MDSTNNGFDEPVVLVPHEVKHLLPNARIVIVLRNPVTRLYSSYKYFAGVRRHFNVGADHFDQYANEAVTWWEKCLEAMGERICAIDKKPLEMVTGWMQDMVKSGYNPLQRFRNSLYYFYVKEWMNVFPRNQLLMLKFEEYTTNPLSTLQEITAFLNVSMYNSTLTYDHIENRNNMHVFQMHSKTYKMLSAFFSTYNQRLTELIKDDRFLWS